MKVVFVLCLIAGLAAALPKNWPSGYKTYRGHQVLEVLPKSREQVDILRTWMIENIQLDFWQEPSKLLEPVHIMAGPQQLTKLVTNLRKNNMQFAVYKNDIERDIEGFLQREVQRRAGKSRAFDINDFNTYEDIVAWLNNDVMAMCADSGIICEVYNTDIQTVEGRDIPVIRLSKDGNDGNPVFLVDSTIHAREWLAPATILKMIELLASGNDEDNMLDTHDMVFIPVLNPDGYAYSWTNERLWRKNRADFGNCMGVDLNRNFDYKWGEEGISTNPCSDLYCGPTGNSEPESLALDAEFEEYADRINNGGAYVTYHAYGYMWMHPWGNTVNHAGQTCERADDHDEMYFVADQTADAIGAVHGTNWARGTSCEVIYETTGGSDDYAKGVRGIKYPFCPELRGNGFIIDADQIQPSFEETWAGMVAKRDALATLKRHN